MRHKGAAKGGRKPCREAQPGASALSFIEQVRPKGAARVAESRRGKQQEHGQVRLEKAATLEGCMGCGDGGATRSIGQARE